MHMDVPETRQNDSAVLLFAPEDVVQLLLGVNLPF